MRRIGHDELIHERERIVERRGGIERGVDRRWQRDEQRRRERGQQRIGRRNGLRDER